MQENTEDMTSRQDAPIKVDVTKGYTMEKDTLGFPLGFNFGAPTYEDSITWNYFEPLEDEDFANDPFNAVLCEVGLTKDDAEKALQILQEGDVSLVNGSTVFVPNRTHCRDDMGYIKDFSPSDWEVIKYPLNGEPLECGSPCTNMSDPTKLFVQPINPLEDYLL